jgi:hypothetical protein
MPRHTFKPGEKEAVAAVLGIEPQMIPDSLELEPEDEDEEDEVIEDEDEDDDEDESDSPEDEDIEDDDEEDEEAEATDEDVEHLKLMDEWRRDYSKDMPFSEFLKNRGK